MVLRAHKEFIEPVTCVNGPVGEDKYLVHFILGGEFIGTKAFKSMTDIDAQLNEMQNDPDLIEGCKEAGLEPTLVFEISEVKSPEERIAELQKELKI
jgi:hypothetical protein